MRLAGEDELHGIFLVVHNLGETVEIGEEKVCAFVSGETACETDYESVGVDFVNNLHHLGRIALVLEPFLFEILFYEIDEFVLHSHSHVPDILVGNIEDTLPHLRIALVVEEILVEMLGIELFPFGCRPGRHMDTIGHITHVRLFGSITFPDTGKHFLGNLSVKPAHAVCLLTGVEAEHTHRETFVGVGILTTHVHEIVPGDAEFCGILAEIFSEERLLEIVVTCRHGSVYGIERRSAYDLKCHIERKMVFLNIIHQTLQVHESRVSFVGMVKVGLYAEFLKHEDTSDAEEIFLLDSVLPVAAIEFVGDLTVPLRILVEVCVEEVEFHAAHVHAPYVAVYHATRIWHFKHHRLSVFTEHRFDRKLVEILALIVGDLLTVDGKRLREVAVFIKESDSSHVDA